MSVKVHKGLWIECNLCNPDGKKDERKDRHRRKRDGRVTPEVAVFRAVNLELGEDPNPLVASMVRLKYGMFAVTKVARKIDMPLWKREWLADQTSFKSTTTPEESWKKRLLEWKKDIPQELSPRYQTKPESRPAPTHRSKPWSQIKHKPQVRNDSRRQDTRTSSRNFGPGRTENRQS
jgi:hypothetical protein